MVVYAVCGEEMNWVLTQFNGNAAFTAFTYHSQGQVHRDSHLLYNFMTQISSSIVGGSLGTVIAAASLNQKTLVNVLTP